MTEKKMGNKRISVILHTWLREVRYIVYGNKTGILSSYTMR